MTQPAKLPFDPMRLLSLDFTPPRDYEPETTIPDSSSLTEFADHYGTNKGSMKMRFTETYDRLMSERRGDEVRLVEIGVACGASLKMWSRYFPAGEIVGVDIRPECAAMCAGYRNVRIVTADAVAEAQPGPWDYIIDDGSHLSGHIARTLRLWWPHLKPGGLYIVEDLHCTHNPDYETPVEHDPADRDRALFVAVVDEMLQVMDQGRAVESIEFRRELMVVRKKG